MIRLRVEYFDRIKYSVILLQSHFLRKYRYFLKISSDNRIKYTDEKKYINDITLLGFLKGKSAIAVARQFAGHKKNFNGDPEPQQFL